MALADAEGTIALASTALEQMFGYQHGQLRGSGSCSTARGKPRGSSAATLEAAPGPFSGPEEVFDAPASVSSPGRTFGRSFPHARGSFVLGASALTAAGLRLLPMLSTRLSFPEVAGLMFLSRHTVKSQAAPVHRKLGACSSRQVVAGPGISAPASR